MDTRTIPKADARSLVPPALFSRLTARIAAEHPELAADMPARIMEQALAFLGTCAVSTESLGPSKLVDIGWHTFVLYTRDYAAFCDRVAGRFIHHIPDDDTDEAVNLHLPLSRAVTAIAAGGFAVDDELWGVGTADCNGGDTKCTQCYQGCHDSP